MAFRLHARRAAAVIGSALFVASLLPACLEPTEIVLHVRTDVPWAAGRSVAFSVSKSAISDATVPSTTTDTAWGADGEVGSLVLLPSGSRDEPITVQVVLGVGRDPSTCTLADAANCIFARRRLAFLPHAPLSLPVTLFAACAGVPCDENSTCTALGTCVSAVVDPETCRDGASCGPSAELPKTPEPADDASSSSDARSALPDAALADANDCPSIRLALPSAQFASWGPPQIQGAATIAGTDPLSLVTSDDDASVRLTHEVSLPPSPPGCELHFTVDVAALQLSAGTRHRDGFVILLEPSWRFEQGGIDAETYLQLGVERAADGSLHVDRVTPPQWPWSGGGTLEFVLPLHRGDRSARVIADGIEYELGPWAVVDQDLKSFSLTFGAAQGKIAVSYSAAGYFLGP